MTGSGCPTCFAEKDTFNEDANLMAEPRTTATMRERKREILARIAGRLPGDIGRARKEATRKGINLDVHNGWESPPGVPNCFGPDPDKDNVWANSPSLVLHSWDEGMVEKFCACTMKWAVHDGYARHGYAATEVCRQVDAAFALTYHERPLNSNVEVNGRDCFQTFPHGVAGYLLKKRRLNAKWYGPICDQLQFFLMGSNLLTPEHKTEMTALAHMIRQINFMLRQPIQKDGGIADYQNYINVFNKKLIKYCTFHIPSKCCSIKFHCAQHWGEHRRQLGCSAMEYSLERALGDHFTRFWPLTNHGQHGTGKDQQLAGIVHRHAIIADLCYHAKMCSSLRQGRNTVDQSIAEVEERADTVVLKGILHQVYADGNSDYEYESNLVKTQMQNNLIANQSQMVFPVVVSDTMRIPIQNRTVPTGSLNRIDVLTLRAKKKFFGKARYDNVMLLTECAVEVNPTEKDIVFARCVAFFRDLAGNHFVGVHWYEKVNFSYFQSLCYFISYTPPSPAPPPQALARHIDLKARLVKVKPMKLSAYVSFDIMPVSCILNGALLVEDRGMQRRRHLDAPHYWVRQSPREYNHLLHFYGMQPFQAGETQLLRDRL
jgi:hypothetical protein